MYTKRTVKLNYIKVKSIYEIKNTDFLQKLFTKEGQIRIAIIDLLVYNTIIGWQTFVFALCNQLLW